MSFARINGIVLHYRLAGPADRAPIVLANSLGTDARIWDDVIARLSGRYRIVSYDKRGHGLSDAPTGPYRLDDHIGDVLGLAEFCGLRRFALAGVSVGGLIAQGIAIRDPARLAALVLCDTAARIGDVALWTGRMETVARQGTAAIADAVMERWFSPAFRHNRPADLAGWRNLFLRTHRDGYIATCATLRDTDLTEDVCKIVTPTLVVAGAEDLSTPPDLVRATAALIPNARFELFEGVGHIPSIEQPGRLAGRIESFLDEVGHV